MTGAEVADFFVQSIKKDLSMGNLFKDNKNNLPLLASFFNLCSSFNLIYAALTNRDGMGILLGVREVVVVILLSCLKTGQFGLRSIADITKLIGKHEMIQATHYLTLEPLILEGST